MLHGLGGTKASFLPSVAALGGSFRIIAVDMLGFGDSSKPLGASYGPAFQADAIAKLLDALELERAHVVGPQLRRASRAGAGVPSSRAHARASS